MDEEYVKEILASVPKGLTKAEFYECCLMDIFTGYQDEVDKAWILYSSGNDN